MYNKWKSRKFWVGLIGQITGIITLAVGSVQGEQFAIIAGAIVTILCALGYIKAEKDVDVARANNPEKKVE